MSAKQYSVSCVALFPKAEYMQLSRMKATPSFGGIMNVLAEFGYMNINTGLDINYQQTYDYLPGKPKAPDSPLH